MCDLEELNLLWAGGFERRGNPCHRWPGTGDRRGFKPGPTALDLESLAADVVALALKAGASDAEAAAQEGDEFSVNVRMGQVETLKESGSRGLGLRVFLGRVRPRPQPAT